MNGTKSGVEASEERELGAAQVVEVAGVLWY